MVAEPHSRGHGAGRIHLRRVSVDHVLVAVGLVGIVIALVTAIWSGV
jgi:hypothetical protein